MTAFIDTSSLIKRYILERHSKKFHEKLQAVSHIIVSPVTITELFSGLTRRLKDKSLTSYQFKIVEEEIYRNHNDFAVVQWGFELEMGSIAIVKKYGLRTLDAIQLASAILSSCPYFITSDQKLYAAAKRVIKSVDLI